MVSELDRSRAERLAPRQKLWRNRLSSPASLGRTVPLWRNWCSPQATKSTAASAGLSAQFFENTWFHPFLSVGVEFVRERERIDVTLPFGPPRDPRAPPIPPPSTETNVRYDARPFVGTGFKVYVSERTFIRSDLRASWSSDGFAGLAWRNGVGVDF